MSLPSDVTVDNLKDFYAMILPYLNVGNGGTSDTPLGQVAFFDDVVAPAGWLIADGTVYNISDYPDLANQYERVHGSKNFYGGNGTTTFAVPDWDAIPAEVFGNSNIICVKAVPSSEMNTYSTTERRVGTDTDGKPVYQKTFTGTTTSADTTVYLDCPGVDKITDRWGYYTRSDGYQQELNSYAGAANNMTFTNFKPTLNNVEVYMRTSSEYVNQPYRITLQYTKTTDV